MGSVASVLSLTKFAAAQAGPHRFAPIRARASDDGAAACRAPPGDPDRNVQIGVSGRRPARGGAVVARSSTDGGKAVGTGLGGREFREAENTRDRSHRRVSAPRQRRSATRRSSLRSGPFRPAGLPVSTPQPTPRVAPGQPPGDAARRLRWCYPREMIGTSLGRYRILEPIGQGGMGRVFLAEDPVLGRRLAIKVLPPEFTHDRARRERLLHEARAASALNHPNILVVHDLGESDGTLYVAMELVDGQTLREWARGKP